MGGDELSEELLLIALTQMYRVLVEVPGTDEVFQLKKEQISRLDFDSMICSPVTEISSISKRIAIFLIRTYTEVTLPSITKKS